MIRGLLARRRRPQRELAPSTRGTAWGLGRGHALGRGSQDSTIDPKGSLTAVPRVDGASRLLAAGVGVREQLSSTDDVIGRQTLVMGESP